MLDPTLTCSPPEEAHTTVPSLCQHPQHLHLGVLFLNTHMRGGGEEAVEQQWSREISAEVGTELNASHKLFSVGVILHDCPALHQCASSPNHTTYPITSHHISSQLITSHHISSQLITSHHIPSHPITAHHISSHLITSHHIPSHHITSHHISSHPITQHII